MNPEKQSSHKGHRSRKRKELLEKGASRFSDTEILEMLLYYVLPRIDTKPIAKRLIEKFGDLEGVINGEKDKLFEISGVKDGAYGLILLLREVVNRICKLKAEPSLLEPQRLKSFLIEIYKGASAESVYALYFAANGKLLDKQLVFRGGVSSVRFSLRAITEGAIRAGARSIVLAHNHPGGNLIPSSDDILSTKRMAAHLAANDIQLIEHYIVGENDCVGIFSV